MHVCTRLKKSREMERDGERQTDMERDRGREIDKEAERNISRQRKKL